MAKHTTKEAYFERIRNLAEVNKNTIKESKIRNLGSLIDYKRAADGTAYGIVKENHLYFLKKASTKTDPDVSDFAYIGGMENITGYQYKSLAEADKQRNMIFHTINSAGTLKPNKTGSKMVLTEGNAGKEIDMATDKLGALDAATDAETQPDLGGGPEGGAEMAAGLDAKPAGDTAGIGAGAGDAIPTDDGGAGPEGGLDGAGDAGLGDETGAGDAGLGDETGAGDETGDGEVSADDLMGGGDEKDITTKEIEKMLGKLTNKLRQTELTPEQVKAYINSYLSAFLDKFDEVEIEDRKEMANKILKVVPDKDIEDLGDSIPQDNADGGPDSGIEEEQCSECGGFSQYAESKGYTKESIMECGEEEVTNLVSGYGNAHNDGQNDGDIDTVALLIKLINPEILNKLKDEYGHEDYAEELGPQVDSMNESSEEDLKTKFNEGWGSGLAGLGKAALGGIGKGITGAAKNVAGAASDAYKGGKEAIGQAGKNVANTYNAASQAGDVRSGTKKVNASLGKIQGLAQKMAADLAKQIAAANAGAAKAGQQPIDVNNILTMVSSQLSTQLNPQIAGTSATPQGGAPASGGPKPSNSKSTDSRRAAYGFEESADPANVVTQPNMLKEEENEEEVEDIDTTDELGDTSTDGIENAGTEETGDGITDILDTDVDAEKEEKPVGFAPDAQSLGVAGAKTTGLDINISPDKTVQISMTEAKKNLIKQIAEGVNTYLGEIATKKVNNPESKKPAQPVEMNESEKKLRKYIRARLEEKAGLRKPVLTESKKSETLKKLDATIDSQYKLFESVITRKKK